MSFIDIIKRNTEKVIGEEHLTSKPRLRVKLGVDPTRPDLTFGHLVVFNKLRQFQDLGHQAVLIIGDYTAMIGDPSGKSALRPALTKEEVDKNAETYLDQAFKILDAQRTEVHRNSEWFGKMSFADCLALTRKMTVARMLERDDFSKRYQDNTPISIVEFLYPLIQGYDSVMLKADVELGGSDQLFNMLVGRRLQEEEGQSPQCVITSPLLVGLDGVKKMSKSYDNYIAFNDSPKDMFGKIMSISDEVMWDYYRLLLEVEEPQIERMKKDEHPMTTKKHLASSLTSLLYNLETAKKELEAFESVFSKNQIPEDMPTFSWNALLGDRQPHSLIDVLTASQLFESNGAARRLLKQGAVKMNSVKMEDANLEVSPPATDQEYIFQAGKRLFFKVVGK